MAAQWFFLVNLIRSILLLFFVTPSAGSITRKAYVVYMGEKPDASITHEHHVNILRDIVESNDNNEIVHEDLLLHSYRRSFHGFAALLTEREAQKLAEMDSVVSIFPSRTSSLQTTNSWNFIGFPEKVKRNIVLERDVIIGVIDTGLWPEAPSFSDDGYGPPPERWKGTCQGNGNFTCNNKVIGARYYNREKNFEGEYESPRDMKGHGTHVASTIAGNLVPEASQGGLGLGTARGGVPSARFAVYKACWAKSGCDDADAIAAYNDAIADGVDILSVSAGINIPGRYIENVNAIGSFHATMNGILVSVSAGNAGPAKQTISNSAPWHLTVASVNTNRRFVTKVELGNGKIYEGIIPNIYDLQGKFCPLIHGRDAPAPNTTKGSNGTYSRYCKQGSLDKAEIQGKIVLCDQSSEPFTDGAGALMTGVAGLLLTKEKTYDTKNLPSPPMPASHIGLEDNSNICQYINKTRNATATIHKSEEINDPLAPYVPVYSSRGPNAVIPNILKPDIAAPGTEILAAYPPEDGKIESRFFLDSGTSMSCPHVSAIATYVKSFHPDWSPAAIRSALMTTAKPMSPRSTPTAEFGYGAGLLDPSRALQPGLVYDLDVQDYIGLLCSTQEYSDKQLQRITGVETISCSSQHKNITTNDLNYPSFALSVKDTDTVSGVFRRTLTNVGSPKSTYRAKVVAKEGLKINVDPNELSFTSLGQNKSFVVTVEGPIEQSTIISNSLVWDDGLYQVRSPIVVFLRF